VAIFDSGTGEIEERGLRHDNGEAERFYRELGGPALIGMEAVGNSQWFERLVAGLGHELWIGDAAEIRASYVRKQKTDRRDAGHILRLLLEDRFPRIWVPSAEQRDQRQLLLHRSKLVRMRTRVKTELQHLALNQGLRKKRSLWSVRGRAELEKLPLEGWTQQRRQDLLASLALLEAQIEPLDRAVAEVAQQNEQALLLMTQPGVGPNTALHPSKQKRLAGDPEALAFVLTVGELSRFPGSRQLSSYLVLIPREASSGSRRRLGAISKQGNQFLRTLLVEAAQSAVQHDPGFRKEYRHRCHHKAKGVAKVAAARKLAVRLYWMLRTRTGYPAIVRGEVHIESSPGHPVAGSFRPSA
jgi:transposase